MSSAHPVDPTWALRLREMEDRTEKFQREAVRANYNISFMCQEVESFKRLHDVNPTLFYTRFLYIMSKLDEYTFFITEFNSASGKRCNEIVLDNVNLQAGQNRMLMPSNSQPDPFDGLLHPNPTASGNENDENANNNIDFGGELIHFDRDVLSVSPSQAEEEPVKEISFERYNGIDEGTSLVTQQPFKQLPRQEMLELNSQHEGIISSVSSPLSFFIIIDGEWSLESLLLSMSEYYAANYVTLKSINVFAPYDFCACRFNEGWCRALVLDTFNGKLHVFLVDIGSEEDFDLKDIQQLPDLFRTQPPFAWNCQLAGSTKHHCNPKNQAFLTEYEGMKINVIIEENSSEQLSVKLEKDGVDIFSLMIAPQPGKLSPEASTKTCYVSEKVYATDQEDSDDEYDEEYDDPLLAVQGYRPRDEADVCRHYKEPPATTCFKGKQCNKKHINIDPNVTGGWTTDEQPVLAEMLQKLTLPDPDDIVKMFVTYADSSNIVFAQLLQGDNNSETSDRPFGGKLARNLTELEKLMNASTSRKRGPAAIRPAVGELVGAPYTDNKLYRARVIQYDMGKRAVEVRFVDYGNCEWVRECDIFELEEEWCWLPEQAIRCILNDIIPKSDPDINTEARKILQNIAVNKTFNALIVDKIEGEDELFVQFYKQDGTSVSDLLIESGTVERKE